MFLIAFRKVQQQQLQLQQKKKCEFEEGSILDIARISYYVCTIDCTLIIIDM
jgi:hypothetical protein